MSEIGLDVGLANDLKLAFRRHDYSSEQVQRLKEGDILGLVRGVLLGTHEIKPIDNIIDLGSLARLPFKGATWLTHRGYGGVKIEKHDDVLYLDGKSLNLFFSRKQQNKEMVEGFELRQEIEKKGDNVSAKVLDYLVDHPELWPENWKKNEQGETLRVFFWDDILCYPLDRLYVLCGYWDGSKVIQDCRWLGHYWFNSEPAVSYAS